MILNRLYYITALLAFLLLSNCKPEKYEHETKIFEAYMNANFSTSIEQNEHYYLLANSFVCKGGISSYLAYTDSLISTNCKNITLVSTLDYSSSESLSSKVNLLKDSTGQLDYENLELNNLTLFYTKKGKIVNISYFTTSNQNEYRAALRKIITSSDE